MTFCVSWNVITSDLHPETELRTWISCFYTWQSYDFCVFSSVTPCSLVDWYRRFRGTPRPPRKTRSNRTGTEGCPASRKSTGVDFTSHFVTRDIIRKSLGSTEVKTQVTWFLGRGGCCRANNRIIYSALPRDQRVSPSPYFFFRTSSRN
jgi:hypothetical protein